MAKKEGNWKSILGDLVKGELIGNVKSYAQNAVKVTQQKIKRRIISFILILLGIVFLIFGGTYYLMDVLQYSRSSIYLVVGLVLILVSIIIAQSAKLLKY
ncbi:MAG: hypothetical protein AABW88_01530 [Nanoarchaeota archaeon]